MTFGILCLFSTRFVSLQVPDIGSFPAGPEPVAGSTPPTHTPSVIHVTRVASSSQQRRRGCQFSPGTGRWKYLLSLSRLCPSSLPAAHSGAGICSAPAAMLTLSREGGRVFVAHGKTWSCWHRLKHPLYSNTEVTLDDLMPVLSSINR